MENIIRLAFSGDILSYQCQNKALKKKYGDYDYSSVFCNVKPLLENVDYAVGSLETPIAGKRAGYTRSPIVFNTPENILTSLKDCGFDMMTTANNHCLDRGIEGLISTIEALDKKGLEHTGTRLKEDDMCYVIKDFDGVRIAFVSYTYGTNYGAHCNYLDNKHKYMVNMFKPQPPQFFRSKYKQFLLDSFALVAPLKLQMKIRPPYPKTKLADCGNADELDCEEMRSMLNVISHAKELSDLVIVLLHVGGQFNDKPGDFSQTVVKECVASGANAVICNHSHTVLPCEIIDGAFVAHCLGNFSFTPGDGYYYDDVLAEYSILLFLDVDVNTHAITPSFSILKNIIDEDNVSRVECSFDSIESSNEIKVVYNRFVGLKEMTFYEGKNSNI